MTAKDWLVEINKWLKRNGYPMYDMRKMTKKEWGILRLMVSLIVSLQYLPPLLKRLDDAVLKKVPLLSTYTLVTVQSMLEMIRREEEEKKKKERIQSEAVENVRRWEKEKRENPSKFGLPQNLLDRFK